MLCFYFKDLAMYPLYHLSFKADLPKRWQPQLPAGSELPAGPYPEPHVKRISCAVDIIGCFRAIYPNVARFFEDDNFPYMVFNVYSPKLDSFKGVVTPQQLTTRRNVWDAHVTGEHWLCQETQMQHVGEVKIYNTNRATTLMTHPFNDRREPLVSAGPDKITWVVLKGTPELKALTKTPAWAGW